MEDVALHLSMLNYNNPSFMFISEIKAWEE